MKSIRTRNFKKEWCIRITIHTQLQSLIEKCFFKGKSTEWSARITWIFENILLMVVLFYVILNTIIYNWTGSLYAEGTGYRLDSVFGPLDNMIPFVPEWAFFYLYIFFPLSAFTMVYFAFFASEKGIALGWSLVLINVIADIVYIFFPVSTYWYRVELLAHPIQGNFWAESMYDYYQTDPSFNCLPSLHAAVSIIVFYAWYRYAKLKPMTIRKVMAVLSLIFAVLIILSTLFVKQHYIIDEITGIILAWVVGKLIFDRFWKTQDKKSLAIEKEK